MTEARPAANPKATPGAGRLWLTGALLLLAGLFVWLGLWQVERRQWKQELIAAVDARAHGTAIEAPPRAQWPDVSADTHAYLHVRATGHFRAVPASFVQAVTDLGAGYWVLSPLDTGDGVILINRGFVTARRAAPAPAGPVEVTGLLRLSEPDGGFLRRNDPAAGRWYSRDVEAIAAARGLADVAPYFIDAARSTEPAGADVPVGGLTVIRFSDNHMSYLLTWFALALMSLGAIWLLWRKSGDASSGPSRD